MKLESKESKPVISNELKSEPIKAEGEPIKEEELIKEEKLIKEENSIKEEAKSIKEEPEPMEQSSEECKDAKEDIVKPIKKEEEVDGEPCISSDKTTVKESESEKSESQGEDEPEKDPAKDKVAEEAPETGSDPEEDSVKESTESPTKPIDVEQKEGKEAELPVASSYNPLLELEEGVKSVTKEADDEDTDYGEPPVLTNELAKPAVLTEVITILMENC